VEGWFLASEIPWEVSFRRVSRHHKYLASGMAPSFLIKGSWDYGCSSWGLASLAPLASESQVVSDFTVLKRMECGLFWEMRELITFPLVGNLGTIIQYCVLCCTLSHYCFSLLGFIRALCSRGCDVLRSNPVVDCSEQ